MIIRFTFILALTVSSLKASDLEETDVFNPETARFSQMATLERWVAKKHHQDSETMQQLQRNVAMEVPQNMYSINFVKPILNNEGDTRYFGKNYYTLQAIQLPFLETVHQISLHKKPIILEIAAAFGLVSWKIPYALEDGGSIYTNELSDKVIGMLDKVLLSRLIGGMRECVEIIPGDCFEIPDNHPELVGNVDVIYVQNLEHFLNPIQHQKFIALIASLLIPGGKAFLTANTLNVHHIKEGHPVYELYIKEKEKGSMYPGFMTCVGNLLLDLETGGQLGDINVVSAVRPDDTTVCSSTKPGTGALQMVDAKGMGMRSARFGHQQVTSNSFTPTIYKNAITPHETLTVVDSFFMDMKGERFEKFSEAPMHFASVIVEKKVD